MGVDQGRRRIPDDGPVLVAIRNAPMDDEPDTEAEIEAMRELARTGEWYDAATVSAEIAVRAPDEPCFRGPGAYALGMSDATETIVVTLPRSVVPELPSLSRGLTDRMHSLLERNTEGGLTAIEREELETLVEMAYFAQILTMAVHGATSLERVVNP